jgi:GPH family glycoside/pentoside/hexuronide:cation symporter
VNETVVPHPRRRTLVLFAFGDFAFNLYWQSVMLFLMFYYTEAVGLPVEIAALTYMVASIWDGIVSLVAGIVVDGRRGPQGYRRWLLVGSAPLGIAFVLAYVPPPWSGWWAAAAVFVGHIVFRTAYAFVNVPYLAMSARISLDSRERSLIAGLRMLFGLLALFVVTQGTKPLGTWLSGAPGTPRVYFAAAAMFALAGTAILMFVGAKVREIVPPDNHARPSLKECVVSLAHNRAFVTLNAATMAMIMASTVLNKSVLYYYKYVFGDEAAGTAALGWMGLAGALAVVFWTFGCRRFGARAAWFAAIGIGGGLLALFALNHVHAVPVMNGFLMAMQMVMTGLNIAFWAMLPNTIEYGERSTGLRVEGTAFGLAALLQRVAIGAATGLLGLLLGAVGYVANVPQGAATLEGMRLTLALVPLVFLLLSGCFMLLNPLTRGAHAGIVAELARRREGP